MAGSKREPGRGYAALISVLVVCTVLSVLAIQSGTSIYFARLGALEAEYRATGYGLAHSCAQISLFELSADPGYRPKEEGDRVWIDPDAYCTIESVAVEGAATVVVVSGMHESFKTMLEITLREDLASHPPFHIVSFREI